LLVYQERPASDRETRYQEEFPLIFSELVLDLPDGQLAISPSLSRERVIQGELHSERVGDRTYTGFRSGDIVTVQGEWQPAAAGSPPVLQDVTGISSADRVTLLAEWQTAFQQVSWARNSLGLLTLLGLVLLVVEWWRNKLGQRMSNELTDAPRAALESVR
jgi:hypothetical protein